MFNELKGKRLLLLGGGAIIDIIKDFAKKNEIYLISVGNNPNSPMARVDEYYNIDSTNHVEMKKFIVEKKVDGVYLGSNETVIRHACQYLNELGLPCYCTLEQWDILQNKGKFKELCQKFDIPVAKRYSYTPTNQCEIKFPVITKPVDGCASEGITICNNISELNTGYKFAYDNSPSHEVIVEELVNNSGMDVFFQITNSNIEFCAIGDKYSVQIAKGSGSIAGARIFPSEYTDDFRKKFEHKIISMFESIGLYQGLIWMEVFHSYNEYYFNEVGYRANGSLSIVGIDYLCKINSVAADIYYALTGKGKSKGFESLILKTAICGKKNVCEYWIAAHHGTIGEITGLETLLSDPNIIAVFPKYNVGDTVPHTNGFAQNFCVIHFAYDTSEEMNDVITQIRNIVRLKDINGNDMIIHKSDYFNSQLCK